MEKDEINEREKGHKKEAPVQFITHWLISRSSLPRHQSSIGTYSIIIEQLPDISGLPLTGTVSRGSKNKSKNSAHLNFVART